MTTTTAPPLYELKEATRDTGLVGEEKNVLTFYLGTLNGKLILFYGPSRSGKDETIKGALYLIDDLDAIEDEESDMVYKWSNSASPKAPFYKHRKLNELPIHIIPDRVAMDEDFEMVVKAFGEGRPAKHEKVDVKKSDAHGPEGQLDEMEIDCPRCTGMSMADDNEKISLNDLAEFNKRAFKLSPDASEEQTRDINQRQVEMRDGSYEFRVDDNRLGEIRDYYRTIPVEKYTDSNAGKIYNLVMQGIQDQEPIPPKFVEARQDVPRLMDFIDAVALYHHADRMEVKSEYPQKLLVAPVDAWYGFKLFGEELVMSAMNLRPLDRKILEFMGSRGNEKFSAMDLQKHMQKEQYGENRAVSEIRTSLDNMIHKMYVQRHEDSPITFSASPFGTSLDVAKQAHIDWNHVVEAAKEKARDNLSEEDADEYIRRFCQGDGLIATHPVTGETVNILEDTEFAEELEEAQESQDDMFGDGLWDGGKASADNDEPAEPAVVTDGGEESSTLM